MQRAKDLPPENGNAGSWNCCKLGRVYFRSVLIKTDVETRAPLWWVEEGKWLIVKSHGLQLMTPAACSVSWYTFGVTTIIWHV